LQTISLRHRFSHAGYQVFLYLAIVAMVFALGALAALRGFDIRPLELRDYNLLHCDLAAGDAGLPLLRILDAVYIEELDMLQAWCSTPQLAARFRGIQARSVHRDRVDLRDLYEDRYDLVLAKPELMDSALASGRQGISYRKLASYPDYGSQLVSLAGTPQLTRAWLEGKTLGMLDDPNSVSGYQIPLSALKNRGLEAVPDIVYYRSYRQLYEALFTREVDVIPALLSDEGPTSALQLPPGLVLEETLPGPAWYVSEELAQDPLVCRFQQILKDLSDEASVHYFRELKFTGVCSDG